MVVFLLFQFCHNKSYMYMWETASYFYSKWYLKKKLIKFSLSITQQLEQQTQTKFARNIKLSNFSATCLTVKPAMCSTYNHLHPNNSMYIPHTVL